MKVAGLPSSTLASFALTDASSGSPSVIRPVAVACPSATPAGRFEAVSFTVKVSVASFSVSSLVSTVMVWVSDPPELKVSVPVFAV